MFPDTQDLFPIISKLNPDIGPIIIGGPARNGKTMLSGAIGASETPYFGMPFELLLNVYMDDRCAFTPGARQSALWDYISSRRATLPNRKKTSAPSDFFDKNHLKSAITFGARHKNVCFGAATILDAIAKGQGHSTWIGADYHVECDYTRLRRIIPGLRLIIAMRDPIESMAASLYWRTFPERLENWKQELQFRVSLWKLAATTAFKLVRRFPDDVLIVNMNRIWDGEISDIDRLANFLGCSSKNLRGELSFKPWFSRTREERFLCPDDSEQLLFSPKEINCIQEDTSGLWSLFAQPESIKIKTVRRNMVMVGPYSLMPRAKRYLITLRHRPGRRLRRSVSRIKRNLRLLLASGPL